MLSWTSLNNPATCRWRLARDHPPPNAAPGSPAAVAAPRSETHREPALAAAFWCLCTSPPALNNRTEVTARAARAQPSSAVAGIWHSMLQHRVVRYPRQLNGLSRPAWAHPTGPLRLLIWSRPNGSVVSGHGAQEGVLRMEGVRLGRRGSGANSAEAGVVSGASEDAGAGATEPCVFRYPAKRPFDRGDRPEQNPYAATPLPDPTLQSIIDECRVGGGSGCEAELISKEAASCLAEQKGFEAGVAPWIVVLDYAVQYSKIVWSVRNEVKDIRNGGPAGVLRFIDAADGAVLGQLGYSADF
jgi:hypothetical protein